MYIYIYIHIYIYITAKEENMANIQTGSQRWYSAAVLTLSVILLVKGSRSTEL